MPTVPESKDEDLPGQHPCTHHWIIEDAKGPTSKGECQLCGDIRMFTNSIVVSDYNTHKDGP